jgi:hypothetical protein
MKSTVWEYSVKEVCNIVLDHHDKLHKKNDTHATYQQVTFLTGSEDSGLEGVRISRQEHDDEKILTEKN